MALQIANPEVTAKIERLAQIASEAAGGSALGRMAAILRQIDRIPDRAAPFDPSEWACRSGPLWANACRYGSRREITAFEKQRRI
jgi:hypothetical protein